MRSHYWRVLAWAAIVVIGGDRRAAAQVEDGAELKLPSRGEHQFERLPPPTMRDFESIEVLSGVPTRRIYAEYNGVRYPLWGWVVRDSSGPERVDAEAYSYESVDPGRELALGAGRTRSDARFVEANGKAAARPEFLLPTPSEQTDPFYSPLEVASTRMDLAPRTLEAISPAAGKTSPANDLLTRIAARPTFGMMFNTGYTGAPFDVKKISLGASPLAGQIRFTGDQDLIDVPLSLLVDNQVLSVNLPGVDEQQLQVYLEANNFVERDELNVKHLFVRLWDKERITLGAGKSYSLFGNGGVGPTTLSSTPTLVGTGTSTADGTTRQFRMQLSSPQEGGWGGGIGVEEPLRDDLVPPTSGVSLTRWPAFVGNLVYRSGDNILQFSGLQRTIGCEFGDGTEQFESAWGLAAFARITLWSWEDNQGSLFFGGGGGDGIGRYIDGIGTSAVIDNGSLAKLESTGAYVGYGHRWKTARGWDCGANVAFGYAHMEWPSYFAATVNRDTQLHQAWANYLVFPNPYLGMGFEWQYGRREIQTGDYGEDNQFMFVIMLTTKAATKVDGNVMSAEGNFESLDGGQAQELRSGVAGPAFMQAL